MEELTYLLNYYWDYAQNVFLFLLKPGQRLFYLYIATSVIAAYFVYRTYKSQQTGNADGDGDGSFVSFLFPKKVWGHKSAWLDLRYFFFHKLIGHFLLLGVLGLATAMSFRWITGLSISSMGTVPIAGTSSGILIAVGYMFVTAIVVDLIGYVIHYLQHKVPVLWEFHKVHHSAEVMHPMSNYREHPVDNLTYLVFIGLGYGAIIGLSYRVIGYLPSVPTILGVPLLMFLFNVVAYNLRHSHVWIRWPGRWSMVFPSPAHHHVHHSCHPEHFDKNFAFMFPVWDVIFGTYTMPKDNRDVRFGVAGMKSNEMDTCMKLYFVPFKKAWRRTQKKRKNERTEASQATSK